MRTRHALSLQVACMLDEQQALQFFFLFLLNKRKFPRVIELCFSCSRLRSSGTSLRKLSTEKGNRDCPEKNKRYFQKVPLILLCLNFSQSLTQLVWTRCPSLLPIGRFLEDYHYIHPKRTPAWWYRLQLPIRYDCYRFPESYKSVSYYSSAGFMLV